MPTHPTPARAMLASAGLAIAALAGVAPAQDQSPGAICSGACCAGEALPDGFVRVAPEQDDAVRRLIEAQTFFSLPQGEQNVIAGKLIAMGEAIPSLEAQSERPNPALNGRDLPLSDAELDSTWAHLAPFDVCSREEFEGFRPVHQRMISSMAEQIANGRVFHVQPCFVPGTDERLVFAVSDIISFGRLSDNGRFEQIGRWQGTALDPGGNGQGNPTILTYSFPPDGTTVGDGVGEGVGTNDLNAFLDGVYGSRAVWRAIYDDIFARWGELSGTTYVLEPNDDGVILDFDSNNPDGIDPNPGVAGVRGDMRMTGKGIDGNSGTLAYNFFPQFGDMVIDTADNFYNGTQNNSIGLRNVLWHEHGHGMGQLHVCPIEELKLMEPFISVAFEGPQFDDVLNAQRDYGDPNEPNDDAGSAVNLGTFGTSGSGSAGAQSLPDPTGMVTLDDDNDVDVYSFTLSAAAEITATLTPQTVAYQAGPQTFGCGGSAPYNPLVFLNPALELLDSNGVSVLEAADVNGAGSAESIVRNLTAGTYYLRATGSQPSGDQIIAYLLEIETDLPGFIGIDIDVAGGLPTSFVPGQAETVSVEITPNQDTIVGTPTLNYQRAGEGSFTSVNLVNTSGDTYEATLPAFLCDEDPELFVEVVGMTGGPITSPDMGTQETIVTSGQDVTLDNVETNNLGWTVASTAVEGQWERGVPQNNGRDDPPADFDGSGQAWLTGQEIGDDNSDIDGGNTVLTGPDFDYSRGGTISYAYWMQDTVNPIGAGDGFFVEYSTNGGTNWTQIRSFTTAGVWRTDTIDVTSEIGTPASLRIRFFAVDADPGDVLECGVDAIEFVQNTCEDPMTGGTLCSADFDGDFDVDLTDFGTFGAAFGSMTGDANYSAAADFDSDGDVDLTDFGTFGSQFGNTAATCMP